MIGTGCFRREQQENQVDRLAVERFEIDRTLQPRKQTEQPAELRQLAVRYSHAVPDARGTELLALQQNLEDRFFALARQFGGAGGKFLQRLLLAVDLERRDDRGWRDEIGERHGHVQRVEMVAPVDKGVWRRRTIGMAACPVNGRTPACYLRYISRRGGSGCPCDGVCSGAIASRYGAPPVRRSHRRRLPCLPLRAARRNPNAARNRCGNRNRRGPRWRVPNNHRENTWPSPRLRDR